MKERITGIVIGALGSAAMFFIVAFRSAEPQDSAHGRFRLSTSVTDYNNDGGPFSAATFLLDTDTGKVWRAGGNGTTFSPMTREEAEPQE